jgi:uncharacterized protein (DUF1684 family)
MSDPQLDVAALEQWQAQMEASLRDADGWLALAGLFWLEEGQNSVGTDEACAIVLPIGSAPAQVGSFVREGARVTLHALPEVALHVNGEPATIRELRDDMSGGSDLVTIGTLTMFVIKRGDRYGIRLRDSASPERQSFTGRIWYPAQQEYVVAAQFVAHAQPQTLYVPTVLGDIEEYQSTGFVTFTLHGQECRLVPAETGKQLFFIIRDATSGHSTYGVGRFLKTDLPHNGMVTLDFNRAYNPPCAFTTYAICPMPPRENHLTVAIAAGERFDGHSHES